MPMSVLWRVLWPLEAWGQRRADAGLGSGSGRVLDVNGGGDGGHSHAHLWAQAQVVRAQWRVRFKQALAWSNGLARPSQPSFQASWRDAPIS